MKEQNSVNYVVKTLELKIFNNFLTKQYFFLNSNLEFTNLILPPQNML